MEERLSVVYESLKEKHSLNFSLKEGQTKLMAALMEGVDCVGLFPTGFGKSIIYLLTPLILDVLFTSKRHISIVISPLKCIMFDQCQYARLRNISAVCVTKKSDMDPNDLQGLKEGKFSVIFISPEILLNFTSFWRNIFLDSEIYRRNVCLIAVDEAHIIDTWGNDFRPAFSKIGDMRSFYKGVPFLLLSATCGETMLKSVCQRMHISNPVIETASPDRPNIFLHIKSEPGMNPMVELEWLLRHIRENGNKAMKTLLYVRNLTILGKMYRDFMGILGESAYVNSAISNKRNRLISCYHSCMSTEDQQNIVHEFQRTNSSIRLIICTVAFGLGVNVIDIRYIVHWGACSTPLEYWQEVGRAGRDGKEAYAYCYAYKSSLNRQVSDDMKRIVRCSINGECIRRAVLSSFVSCDDTTPQPATECRNCKCCSVCKSKYSSAVE